MEVFATTVTSQGAIQVNIDVEVDGMNEVFSADTWMCDRGN